MEIEDVIGIYDEVLTPSVCSSIIKFTNLFKLVEAKIINDKIKGGEVNKKITNYFSPYDDVLKVANDECWVDSPLGYNGASGASVSKYTQIMVKPRNHRFVSYARTIKSFP